MRRTHLSGRLAAATTALLGGVLTLTLLPAGSTAAPVVRAPLPAAAAAPALTVTTEISGLQQPWDVQELPDGSLLVTERERKRLLRYDAGSLEAVDFDAQSVWASGETGLMSLAVDPDFAQTRRILTCQGGFNSATASRRDVRVVAWRMSPDLGSATRIGTIVTGLPATSGRHGGCRLLVTTAGDLLVGTGDAAQGRNPRNLRSLGGKVLRFDGLSSRPHPANPFVRSPYPAQRRVLTYGHRNVQGLAQRLDNGRIFSVEHGSYRDDEVNLLMRGGDYGWNPVPGYNESVPMTDQSLPGVQRAAAWRSGEPTVATSGASYVAGTQWGSLRGAIAVAALKGERVMFMRFGARNRLLSVATPPELRTLGRLRSVTQLADGDLLVTTANGTNDRVVRVSPS